MNVYVESSALAAWLFGENEANRVREVLSGAKRVISSELTLIECDRAVIRALTLGAATERQATERQGRLAAASAPWVRLRIGTEVVERCRRPFPVEPVRTLDAIHLASALLARSAVPDLVVLSLDDRVRLNAKRLGFPILPR